MVHQTDVLFEKINNLYVGCKHTTYFFENLLTFTENFYMTTPQTKTQDTSPSVTPQQHHVQAATHLGKASAAHSEAAKCMSASDHKAAATHVAAATEHVAHAQEHVVSAAQKTATIK